MYRGKEVFNNKFYIKKTGSLNWISLGSRLNIIYTVGKLVKSNIKLIDYYLVIIKYLWRYFTGYPNLSIILGGKFLPIDDL
ncbi:hypothetical protein QBC45DRAFT_322554 [Copromyces sp. CBS 386.78]|nr:hypothetical protein QBC45DRAFT_322554 [Copromyces sp. CBS 386.78]